MKVDYVLGFYLIPTVFRDLRSSFRLPLILKNKPEFQAGRYNGIGGRVESFDETPFVAMAREFSEETGKITSPTDWRFFTTMSFPNDNHVHCFSAIGTLDGLLLGDDSPTDERVVLFHASLLPDRVMSNLRWLIPMAIRPDGAPSQIHFG
jgi:8-oxo-dGTP diphosphatase